MKRIVVSNFVPIISAMMQIAQVASTDEPNRIVPDGMRTRTITLLHFTQRLCIDASLEESIEMIGRLTNEQFQSPVKAAELQHTLDQLMKLIESESAKKLFFVVQPEDANRYDQERPFGDQVWRKFEGGRIDATEAGNCLALGRYSASVHHSMLALEPGLRALAAYVGLELPRQTWGTIVDKIERRIGEELTKRNGRSSLDLQFASEAATQFSYVREAWRNHSAHGHAHYDREQAISILEHTKMLMRVLVAGLA
jgi:hypothetical protein